MRADSVLCAQPVTAVVWPRFVVPPVETKAVTPAVMNHRAMTIAPTMPTAGWVSVHPLTTASDATAKVNSG
jgi:hypothetical protein